VFLNCFSFCFCRAVVLACVCAAFRDVLVLRVCVCAVFSGSIPLNSLQMCVAYKVLHRIMRVLTGKRVAQK
jgi:hypothetical protein